MRVQKNDSQPEATQVAEASRQFKLTALGLVAVTRVMQPVDARDGSPRPATNVIDAKSIPPIGTKSKTREGATPHQKNRDPEGSLAWLAWVAARLGGWTGYYGQPGSKTMAASSHRLTQQLADFHLAQASHKSAFGGDV